MFEIIRQLISFSAIPAAQHHRKQESINVTLRREEEGKLEISGTGNQTVFHPEERPSRVQKRFAVIVHRVFFSSAIILCLLFRIVMEHSR